MIFSVLLTPLAKGVIIRRPRVMALAERQQWDACGIRAMQRLRAKHGLAPYPLRIFGRQFALLIDPAEVERVLEHSPEPFAPATREKTAALRHFQPHGVLTSRGELRELRRAFNEIVLAADVDVEAVVEYEVDRMLQHTTTLDWDTFAVCWWRIVRRIVLGTGARDDNGLTDSLAALRRAANWAFLRPQRRGLRRRFQRGLAVHLDRAEQGTLAAAIADVPVAPGVDPYGQVPHWLFAFDAAGMSTFRALTLPPDDLAVLEAVRLWPTTPLLLRESTVDGTTYLIYTPFFHRDDETLPFAHRFAPEIWRNGRKPALVPFSAGPGVCPGRDLVLRTGAAVLTALRARHHFTPSVSFGPELPATLNHFGLRFEVN
ncbi:cytochrome P450 [Lentzea tibetensis]|uniref:Cytochrome P450 n=1 Tax=Lentzea tibetensis TaxID=2591470 RepID=A0A563F0E5_9PSEU|nr:cytochrome P450 [Lentzea tibetensis]TWP53363.1 cytochrome P450 [Lentzea tibetensis]